MVSQGFATFQTIDSTTSNLLLRSQFDAKKNYSTVIREHNRRRIDANKGGFVVYDPDQRDKFKAGIKAEMTKTSIGFQSQYGGL